MALGSFQGHVIFHQRKKSCNPSRRSPSPQSDPCLPCRLCFAVLQACKLLAKKPLWIRQCTWSKLVFCSQTGFTTSICAHLQTLSSRGISCAFQDARHACSTSPNLILGHCPTSSISPEQEAPEPQPQAQAASILPRPCILQRSCHCICGAGALVHLRRSSSCKGSASYSGM